MFLSRDNLGLCFAHKNLKPIFLHNMYLNMGEYLIYDRVINFALYV
jgi:hypothetical protein